MTNWSLTYNEPTSFCCIFLSPNSSNLNKLGVFWNLQIISNMTGTKFMKIDAEIANSIEFEHLQSFKVWIFYSFDKRKNNLQTLSSLLSAISTSILKKVVPILLEIFCRFQNTPNLLRLDEFGPRKCNRTIWIHYCEAPCISISGRIVNFTSGEKNQEDPGGSFSNTPFLARIMPVYTVALKVCLDMWLRNWRL